MRMFGEPVSFRAALKRARGFRALRGVPVIVPPEHNVNHSEFVALVRRELRPDAGLSLGCEQIIGGELLAARPPVNYHTGVLPAYRGPRSTAWSLYRGEPVTGLGLLLPPDGRGDRRGTDPRSGIDPHPSRVEAEQAWSLTRSLAGIQGGRRPGRRPISACVTSTGSRLSVTLARSRGRSSNVAYERFGVLTISIRGEPHAVTRLRRIDFGRLHRRDELEAR
jgi:hypothetical protein